ncbi:DUF3466 family protein [Alteromonas gilva]|uniref:DUF3466 family protein n=1 Tax=Alteromonas gilva TaxID=2987522 RepID=A0ABT5L5K9_9ALTE|nr:DUF3466 family protein [Alteromonas gilva]MDC8831053.1 DUF3466 family protein [Alteromonas gilva]
MKLKQLASAVILATSSIPAMAATYNLDLVPVQDKSFFNFAQSIDNTGTLVTVSESEYNPPIDLSLLNFDSEAFRAIFADPDAAEVGDFTNRDYQAVYSFIVTNRGRNDPTFQAIANYRSYQGDTVDAELIPGFDVIDDATNDYTRSAFSIVNDSYSGQYFVGSGNTPFFKVDTLDSNDEEVTYVLNDTYRQAFVAVNGVTTPLPPTSPDMINGISEAFSINSSLQVAGWGSSAYIESVNNNIELCFDDEERGDVPIELCTYSLGLSLNEGSYRRAMIWQLDAQGNLLSTTEYGLLFEPEEDNNFVSFTSRANAINDNGIAVGASHNGESVVYTLPAQQPTPRRDLQSVATTFIDGETAELLPENSDNLMSEAIDINNDNWVVGTVLQENNNIARNQLFLYNIDSGEEIYPQGFFQTAGVKPRAINNNGIVVGEGEFESQVQVDRELRAFMYDLNVGEFINLNTLLTCEQRQKYTLVTAMDINDNNEIIANARVIDDQRYITGEKVLNSAGETNQIDRVVAVKLTPNSAGSVEQCEQAEEPKYERSGASASWYGLAVLSVFALMRRRLRR